MSSGSTLIGGDLPPTRALAVLWAGGAGWIMSCAVGFGLFGPGAVAVLALAIPAGLLSAGAVYWVVRAPNPTTGQFVAASVGAACFCPLATLLPIVAFEAIAGRPDDVPGLLGAVFCFGVVGAFLTLPFGALFGAIFALAFHVIDLGRAHGKGASVELSWALFGLGWVIVGGILVVLGLTFPFRPLPEIFFSPTPPPNLMTAVSACLAGTGVLFLLAGAARLLHRHRLAERARRGTLPGFAVVPLSDVQDAWLLPRLFPFGRDDAVLVRRRGGGPFRDVPDVPLARMAR